MKLCFNEATTLKNSTLEQDLVLCEKAGFDYIEIWICQLEKYLQHNKLDDLISFFAKSTIKPFALDSFEDILFCTDTEYAKLRSRVMCACLWAKMIGCDRMVMVPTVCEGIHSKYTKEQITEESVRVLSDLAQIAAAYDVKLAFEPIGLEACAVRSISHAWEIVKKVDLYNVGLTLDVFNDYLYNALEDMDDIAQIPGEKIFIYHIDDAPVKPLNEYKLDHSDRVLPGNGELPCTDMTRMVKETGYNSAISVELFNEKLYGDTAENVIGQAYNAVQAHVAAANIEKEIDFPSNT